MSQNKILALSSSRVGSGGYLQQAAPQIKNFLGSKPLKIAFVPFASVSRDYEAYSSMVTEALENSSFLINTVLPSNASSIIEDADAIMVGGGNTFKLLHHIYAYKLLDLVREKVNSGCPYIGWSAGSNILSPGIGTTNDMPVIEPKTFDALGLFPFQVNPHYTNEVAAGHNGETRDQRLEEFVIMNAGLSVVALPEGTGLWLENSQLRLTGNGSAFLFSGHTQEETVLKTEIPPNADISYLL